MHFLKDAVIFMCVASIIYGVWSYILSEKGIKPPMVATVLVTGMFSIAVASTVVHYVG